MKERKAVTEVQSPEDALEWLAANASLADSGHVVPINDAMRMFTQGVRVGRDRSSYVARLIKWVSKRF